MTQELQLGAANPVWLTTVERPRKSTLAYQALVLFSWYYNLRPEDFIPGLNAVPLGKIAGGIALLALLFGVKGKDRGKIPTECIVLLLLLVQLILTIPFAFWRGGAFNVVVNKFSKGPILALLIALAVMQVVELRKLLFIQSAVVALMTVASIAAHHTIDGRLMGIQKGILENPNELAINIAINLPLCLAFLFAAKGGLRKSLWAFGVVCMMYAVVATYSRSGIIATLITSLVCLWEFGVKGKRSMLVLSAGLIALILMGVMIATPKYVLRMETMIWTVPAEKGTLLSHAQGSAEARSQLLHESISLMLHNPIFGVGPGNFPAITQSWRVAHNTYTEFGAEAGIPAFVLFVLLLWLTLRKIRRVRRLPGYAQEQDIRLWTSALSAAMVAYVVGAFFASTEYNLFPYFMVGFVCALYRIASNPEGARRATQEGYLCSAEPPCSPWKFETDNHPPSFGPAKYPIDTESVKRQSLVR